MQIKTFFTRTPLINIFVFGLGFLLLIAHIFKKQKNMEANKEAAAQLLR